MLTVPSTDWENDSGFGLDPQQFRNLTHSRVDKHLQGIKNSLYYVTSLWVVPAAEIFVKLSLIPS